LRDRGDTRGRDAIAAAIYISRGSTNVADRGVTFVGKIRTTPTMRAYVLALILGGCGFSGGSLGNNPDAGGTGSNVPIDAAISAPPIDAAPTIDAAPAMICAGTFIRVCVGAPQPAITLSRTIDTGDTSASSACLPAAAYTATPAINACVIAGQTISIPDKQTVTVFGTRPLILLAADSITITGTLDAASHIGSTSGAGANVGPAADLGPCSTTFTNPTAGAMRGDGGGGFGGSFGAAGNGGGNGAIAGIGGVAAPAILATALRGGCPGSAGAGAKVGALGHGGGAVLLIAGQTVAVPGVVNASGGAGGGAPEQSGGGGGGGSGGMIVLDAQTVNVTGQCFANGGGGGEGANVAADGHPGGESSAPDKTASGGSGGTDFGGDGGKGGNATNPGGSPGSNGDQQGAGIGGGGAGGGGVGVIKVFATQQTGTTDGGKVSPHPS
jgi:hypothetical protein